MVISASQFVGHIKANMNNEILPIIDESLQLNQKHLHLFKKCVNQIEDKQINKFIHQLINILQIQEQINKSDILSIINNLNLTTKIKGIYLLCWLRVDGSGYAYPYGFTPFLFYFVFENFFIDEFYLGPALIVKWTSPYADTKINGIKIYDDEPQNGYVFGFLGYTYYGGIWPTYCTAIGFCQLVIITNYEDM
jgi:hypothetical protein